MDASLVVRPRADEAGDLSGDFRSRDERDHALLDHPAPHEPRAVSLEKVSVVVFRRGIDPFRGVLRDLLNLHLVDGRKVRPMDRCTCVRVRCSKARE